MKHYGYLYPEITSFENLVLAANRAQKSRETLFPERTTEESRPAPAIDAIKRIDPNITPDRSSPVATLPNRYRDRPSP
jgi:hypothetical protein